MAVKPTTTATPFVQLAHDRYRRVLRAYLMNRVRNHEDARELAQEVWTRLLRVTDPKKVLDPRRYIYRVAAHVVAEFQDLKRRNPVQFDSEIFATTADTTPGENEIEQLDAQRDAMRALEPLSPAFREIILLRIRAGMSYEDIGARLGFSGGTAKRYYFSAMALARAAWTERTG